MNIIYKHKETGAKISLEDIKKNPDFECQLHKNIFAYLKGTEVMSFPKICSYKLKDIPLSDDFEIETESNPYDFDECEIYTLLNALNLYPYSTAHELKLKDKLVKIYKKLKGWD